MIVVIHHHIDGLRSGPMPWDQARELCDKMDEIKQPYTIRPATADEIAAMESVANG